MINVQVKRLSPTARLPIKGSVEAACFDLFCDSVSVEPSGYVVQTGLALALPPGFCMLIHPRSGLATKLGLTLQNTTGIIDSDYRGEIVIKLNKGYDHKQSEIMETLSSHGRVAQALILQVPEVMMEVVTDLPASDRGDGGFGSTGIAHHSVQP